MVSKKVIVILSVTITAIITALFMAYFAPLLPDDVFWSTLIETFAIGLSTSLAASFLINYMTRDSGRRR